MLFTFPFFVAIEFLSQYFIIDSMLGAQREQPTTQQMQKLQETMSGQTGDEGKLLLDRDSQSLYTAAILENGKPNLGTESKTSKKSERKCRGIPRRLSMRICVYSAQQRSDWPVSKYSVKHGRHTAPCTTPHCATHCTTQHESQRTVRA